MNKDLKLEKGITLIKLLLIVIGIIIIITILFRGKPSEASKELEETLNSYVGKVFQIKTTSSPQIENTEREMDGSLIVMDERKYKH